jgi:hypothetical protein
MPENGTPAPILRTGLLSNESQWNQPENTSIWHFQCSEKAMNKVWLGIVAVILIMAGVIARLRAAMKFQVPLGYQDETGFHAGVKHEGRETSWPPFW